MFSSIFIPGGQIATWSMSGHGKARRRGRLFRLLLQMDQRSAVCWMDGCVLLCVCTVYMGADCQTPSIETAGVHGWVQEMTTIMPKCPVCLCDPRGDGYGM